MTTQRTGATRLIASAFALALAGGGCSLIVSGDVADFACTGASASACPSGLVCDVASGRCVSDAGIDPVEAGEEDAPVDEDVKDAGKEADATGPLDLGAKCRVDSECKSRLCGTSTILTTTITSTHRPHLHDAVLHVGRLHCRRSCASTAAPAAATACRRRSPLRQPPATGGKSGGSTCTVEQRLPLGLSARSPTPAPRAASTRAVARTSAAAARAA